jgi:hypothetical protein
VSDYLWMKSSLKMSSFIKSYETTSCGDDETPKSDTEHISKLEFSLWMSIAKFVGFSETQRNFAQVTKAFYYFFERSKLQLHPLVEDAHLVEVSGRSLSELLDIARFSVYAYGLSTISPAAANILKSGIVAMPLLRRGYMNDLAALNSGVYSYWDNLGSAPEGVFDYIKSTSDANPHCKYHSHIEQDVQYWRTSRLFGDFYVVCCRPDGTVIMSKNLEKVYLVLGLAQSLVTAITGNSTISNRYIGIVISTTLLNWEGRIAYDGLAIGHKDPIPATRKKKIIEAYVKTMDQGTIITALDKVPPIKKIVSSAPTKEDLELLRVKLKPLVKNIAERKQRKVDLNVSLPTNPMDMWVFRRHGYTEKENPDRLLSVFTAEGPIMQFHRIQSFHVTAEEIVRILDETCQFTKMRPLILMVDEIDILQTVRQLLSGPPCNIRVEYYPPPSAEERARSDMTNPYLPHQPLCNFCGSGTTPEGTKLMVCSRCASTYYCCREHQKADWKVHKMTCK